MALLTNRPGQAAPATRRRAPGWGPVLDRRSWRVLAGFVAFDAVCFACGPLVLALVDTGHEGAGHTLARIVGWDWLVVLPFQVLVGWLLLGQPVREARRIHRNGLAVERVLADGAVHPHFQPIVDARTGRVAGFEALSRFPGLDVAPQELYADARRVGRGVELELLSVRRALAAAHDAPEDAYVAVNVGPRTLRDPQLVAALLECGMRVERIVVEVTEHARIHDYAALRASRETLRAHGVRFAVDDAGAGYASLRHVAALDPDIVKIDRSLVAGVASDPARGELVRALVQYTERCGITLVAEGLETPEDRAALLGLGVAYVQGELTGGPRPSVRPHPVAAA